MSSEVNLMIKNLLPLIVVIMLSGCMGEDMVEELSCQTGPATQYEWMDSHQWNGAPMSYGNSTIFEINNTSDGVLHLNISVDAYFSESNALIEQGYFNLSIYGNDTLLWSNQTSIDAQWDFNLNISVNETIHLEIQASGKDEHPDNDYGDYFLLEIEAQTNPHTICA